MHRIARVSTVLCIALLAACGSADTGGSVLSPTLTPSQTPLPTASAPLQVTASPAPPPTASPAMPAPTSEQAASAAPLPCPPANPSDDHPPPLPRPQNQTPAPNSAADDCATASSSEPIGETVGPASGGGQAVTVVATGGESGAPNPPEPLTTTTPLHGPGVVSLDDNGQTLQLAVGDSFEVRLGNTLQWTISVENTQILVQAADATVGPEAQAIFRAAAPGETTLAAFGEAACRRAKPPCMMPSMMFQITVVVQ